MFGKNFSFGEKNSAPNKPKVGFTGRLKPLIALDISSMAVKLLELGKKGRKFSVESYAVEPLPPNAVQERRIVDEEAVGETIRRAVKRAKTKTKDAAIAVPGSA
ncbi:MAG: type IV pilus biogenesis protein PilM, partial [Gammaproteobacteria bacterium]